MVVTSIIEILKVDPPWNCLGQWIIVLDETRRDVFVDIIHIYVCIEIDITFVSSYMEKGVFIVLWQCCSISLYESINKPYLDHFKLSKISAVDGDDAATVWYSKSNYSSQHCTSLLHLPSVNCPPCPIKISFPWRLPWFFNLNVSFLALVPEAFPLMDL